MGRMNEERSTQTIWDLGQHISRMLATIMARATRYDLRTAFFKPFTDRKASSGNEKVSSRGATAYLDGLRGVAALGVLLTHTQEWAQGDYGRNMDILRSSFGSNDRHIFACLPGVRIFFGAGGGIGVSLFYIMSGYVLTSKPHKLIMAQELDSLSKCISSAIFRRWFRLFLPIFALNFIWVTSWYLGVKSVRPVNDHKPISDSYTAELHRFLNVMFELSSLFGQKERERFRIYNPPIWTIPPEFEGSVVVYMSMLAFSRFTPKFHLLSEAALWIYFVYLRQFSLALFVSGMIICHIDTLNRGSYSLSQSHVGSIPEKWRWILWYTLWLAGICMASVDARALDDTFWAINLFAAISMMIAIPRIPWIKSLLESQFCQYLGRISYALYLSHMPVLWILGGRIFAFFGRFRGKPEVYGSWGNVIPLPGAGPLGIELNTIVPGLFFILCAFVVGNVATRYVDEPSVKFAQWLYRKGTSGPDTSAVLPESAPSRDQHTAA